MRFITILTIFACVFTLIFQACTGNLTQQYNDIIIEWSAWAFSNKSSEMLLLYLLAFGGITFLSLDFFFSKKNSKNTITFDVKNILLPLIFFMFCIQFVFLGKINILLLLVFLLLVLFFSKNKSKLVHGLCFAFMTVYSYIAFIRLLMMLGLDFSSSMYLVFGLLGLFFSVFLLKTIIYNFADLKNKFIDTINNEKLVNRIILIEQLFVPCLFLNYLIDKYKMPDGVLHLISEPIKVRALIYSLILLFIVEAIYLLKKNWNNEIILENIYGIGTCVSVLSFNSSVICGKIFNLSGISGRIMSIDLHHPFENIISYSQIFQQGQQAFSNYVPISGLYSVIQGWFFEFFSDGLFAGMNFSENVFYFFIATILIVLLKKHVNSLYAFLFSVVYLIIQYNRAVFVLPIILLLTLPNIVQNKNRWLFLWVFTTFLNGLYYPLFGFAVGLGFFPLAMYQLISLVKSEDIKLLVKKFSFWFIWTLMLILILTSYPLLIGTYKQIISMSGQSLFADGLSRFGQIVSDFMPYLEPTSIFKLCLFSLFTFVLPTVIVWFSIKIMFEILAENKENKILHACIVSSIAIILLVSYSYTFIRLDFDSLFARSNSVLLSCVIVLMIFSIKYVNNASIKKSTIYLGIIVAAFSGTGLNLFNHLKLEPYHSVPIGYEYVENEKDIKLGTGFIRTSDYRYLKEIYSSFDKNHSYFAKSNFGNHYLCGAKGDSIIESYAVKSYKTTLETIKLLKKNKTIVGADIDTTFNYYLYNWLLTSGEYVWNRKNREFVPNLDYSYEEVIEKNQQVDIASNGIDFGKSSAALGESYSSLNNIFSKINIDYQIHKNSKNLAIEFDNPLYGNDCDFLYIEFKNMDNDYKYSLYNANGIQIYDYELGFSKYFMKKNYNSDKNVKIQWFDVDGYPHFVFANIHKGKLLIPLGAGSKWLLNKHSNIYMYLIQGEEEIDIPELSKIEFLKLRELK